MYTFRNAHNKGADQSSRMPSWSAPVLFANPEDRFSGVEAQIVQARIKLLLKKEQFELGLHCLSFQKKTLCFLLIKTIIFGQLQLGYF